MQLFCVLQMASDQRQKTKKIDVTLDERAKSLMKIFEKSMEISVQLQKSYSLTNQNEEPVMAEGTGKNMCHIHLHFLFRLKYCKNSV